MIGNRTSGAWRASGADAVVAAICALIAVGASPVVAFGQCQYEVTAIIEGPPCFPSGNAVLIGWGLNNHGDVVGRFRMCGAGFEDEAFFWSEDTGLIALPMPDGTAASRAYDIKDNRRIVGEYRIPFEGWFGFMYDMNTGEFLHLPSKHDWGGSVANAINNNSIAAGARSIGEQGTQNPPSNAVIWDTNTGEVVDLGVMNGPNSWASDIPNTSTDTVGSTGTTLQASGYRQVEGDVELLSKFFQFSISFCHGTGDFGFVTGSGIPIGSSDSSAFLWVGDNLLLLDPLPSFSNCGASDVNAFGHVVTRCSPGDVPGLWQNGEIFNLNDLIISGSATIKWPRAINNQGQILLRLGDTRAVLITPVDVPFADLNYDCAVNEHDLLILLAAFGPQPAGSGSSGLSPHPADLNGDGIVNLTDLLIMLGNWNR